MQVLILHIYERDGEHDHRTDGQTHEAVASAGEAPEPPQLLRLDSEPPRAFVRCHLNF
jgi:hypothetical protein